LQDYIEGELDQSTAQEVAQHLQSCARCAKELEYLKQHLSNMKGLEKVRAPKDFLERVHRRIEESPEERTLFHTLFSPPRFKIPLELSAVAVMVIAVIFVLQVTRPMKRQEPVVVDKEINNTRALPYEKREEEKPEEVKPEKTEHVQKTKPSEPPASEGTLQAKEMKPSEGTAALEESPAERTTVSSERPSAPERKRESKAGSAETLLEGGRPGVLRPATELTVVMVLTGEMKQEEEALKASPAAAEQVPSEYSKELKAASNAPLKTGEEANLQERAVVSDQEETALVSKTQGRKASVKQVQERPAGETENSAFEKAADLLFGLVQSEGGTVVAKSFPNTSDQPLVVTADIPSSHINDFLDKLGGYGEIQIPPIGEAEKKAITVRMRIEIRLPVQ